MSKITSIANGADPVQQQAASDGIAVQAAACNLIAVVGCLHRYLLALHRSGVCGADLINHPVALRAYPRTPAVRHAVRAN